MSHWRITSVFEPIYLSFQNSQLQTSAGVDALRGQFRRQRGQYQAADGDHHHRGAEHQEQHEALRLSTVSAGGWKLHERRTYQVFTESNSILRGAMCILLCPNFVWITLNLVIFFEYVLSIDWLIDWLIELIDWIGLIDWLIRFFALIDWIGLIDWLIDWLDVVVESNQSIPWGLWISGGAMLDARPGSNCPHSTNFPTLKPLNRPSISCISSSR